MMKISLQIEAGQVIEIDSDRIDFEPEDRSVGIFGNCVICGKSHGHEDEFYVIFDDGSVRDHNETELGKLNSFTDECFTELVRFALKK